jgi:integrase
LLGTLGSLFGWLLHQRRITVNPCAGIHQPPPARARERVLNSDEIRWLWRACDAIDEPFRSIIRLLALTGQRVNEVAGMRRTELHDDGSWHLPGARTKNRKPHVVPLPALARTIIDAVPPGASEFVFTTSAGRPATNWSAAKTKLDRAMLAIAQEEDFCSGAYNRASFDRGCSRPYT